MRPICRGSSPIAVDFDPYNEAQRYLISRLGAYCSYCERRIATQLAVEHIQPKGLPNYSHLIGRWENFLVSCVNCNSTKKSKDVVLSNTLLPDRDNTFLAFEYSSDGTVEPSAQAKLAGMENIARKTLALTGLDKAMLVALDDNDRQVALDRVAQRREVWAIALDARQDIEDNPNNLAVRKATVTAALGHGFFSIWMTVFNGHTDMCNRFVDAFVGTKASGCFDPQTAAPISPAPNPDTLSNGGKI